MSDMVDLEEDISAAKKVEDSLMVVVPADALMAALSVPVSRHGHSPLPRSMSVTAMEAQPSKLAAQHSHKTSPIKARHSRRSSLA